MRRREATAACKHLKAKPKFFDSAHNKLVADEPTVEVVRTWLKEAKPDIVVDRAVHRTRHLNSRPTS